MLGSTPGHWNQGLWGEVWLQVFINTTQAVIMHSWLIATDQKLERRLLHIQARPSPESPLPPGQPAAAGLLQTSSHQEIPWIL